MSTLTKAGRYELREELGRGAMGVVFRAHDPVIGRDVAVKTMHLSEAGTGMSRDELIGRFQTEARAAGLLAHPNIVVVFDAGEEEGVFYITMELVEGRSLQTMLDGRQLFPLPRVMRLMEQVCSALDFAHQRNVVHRDIKPANLMLTGDDTVKITDFGTAKILQFGTAQTAHVMGTPSYMSPEQVKGKPVDGRSDIFSLGVILYELMTGEKPFPGQNITTVIYKIINEEPIPPRSLDSSIHPGLSEVITRALAKDPSKRFQSCHELLDALKNYRDLVSPEATVRMSPARQAALSESGASMSSQTPATPLIARTSGTQASMRPPSPVFSELEHGAGKKRGSLLLSLILIGIIGFAGYRVWPPLLDIWQHMKHPTEMPVYPSQAPTAAPAVNSIAPDSKPEPLSQASPSLPLAAPGSGGVSPSSPETIAAKPLVKASEPPAVPTTISVEKKTPPQEGPAALPAPSAASSLKSKLGPELAGLQLKEKVNIQVTGNTLTVSGGLTPKEHSEVLNLLHSVPAGVRVIDNIGYADEVKEATNAAEVGWVWIRSTPQGAEIFLDGADTRKRTPARIETPQGEHELSLILQGFANGHRTVLLKPGQNIEFTEILAKE